MFCDQHIRDDDNSYKELEFDCKGTSSVWVVCLSFWWWTPLLWWLPLLPSYRNKCHQMWSYLEIKAEHLDVPLRIEDPGCIALHSHSYSYVSMSRKNIPPLMATRGVWMPIFTFSCWPPLVALTIFAEPSWRKAHRCHFRYHNQNYTNPVPYLYVIRDGIFLWDKL